MSEAIIAKKAEQVAIVAEKMKAAASIVVVDSRGLTVDQDTVLRRNLRESGVEFKVIKNSILSRAAEEAGLEDLKELSEFAKDAEALEIKGGVVDGAFTSVEEINALASLPNKEGMLSMLLSVLQAPVRNVAYAVKAVAESKEDGTA